MDSPVEFLKDGQGDVHLENIEMVLKPNVQSEDKLQIDDDTYNLMMERHRNEEDTGVEEEIEHLLEAVSSDSVNEVEKMVSAPLLTNRRGRVIRPSKRYRDYV